MSDDEAYAAFKAVRFAENGGEPFCPHCGCDAIYTFEVRRLFKCKACEKQFTATSGTIFACRKMALRDILLAIALFVNGANGHSALRMSRDLKCQYKTAFVLLHKLREAMGAQKPERMLTGVVEIDGAWVGGHAKQKNLASKRVDRRKKPIRPETRRSIVTLRERRRGGRSLSFAFKGEHDAIDAILKHVHPEAQIVTDEAAHWNILEAYFVRPQRINHSHGYSIGGIHTNWVESFNSRIRRAQRGVYIRIAGAYLQAYADEISWREDHRRSDNGQQFMSVMAAAAKRPAPSNMA